LLSYLESDLSFSSRDIVGSGTGILTELLLRNGNRVLAIDPYKDMRRVAETNHANCPHFKSVDGSAESTGLAESSVDLITAAQSFHWVKIKEARAEFRRILVPNGWVVILWNTRKTSTPFLQEYEALVAWLSTQKKDRIKHEGISENALAEFLGVHFRSTKLSNLQRLDLGGLIGRLMSASYSPLPHESLHAELVRRVRELFNMHQKDGTVTLEYCTEVYAGQLS